MSAMSNDVPPEIVEHSYANPNKEEESSSDCSSSDSTSSSDAEQTTNKPGSRIRVPPERHVDIYATATPKTPPGDKIKSPKRLSTSVSRKAKEPLRRRRSEGSGASTSSSLRRRVTLEKIKNSPSSWARLRSTACGQCEGCKRDDCGECVYCKDKIKFGGPGKKKQKCLLRACKEMPIKNKLVNIATLQKKMAKSPSQASTSSTPQKSLPSLKQTTITTPTITATPKSSSLTTTTTSTTVPAKTTASTTPSVVSTSAALSNLAKVVQSITSKPSQNNSSTSMASSPAGTAVISSSLPKLSVSAIKLPSPINKSSNPAAITVGTALTIASETIAKVLQATVTPNTTTAKVLAPAKSSTPSVKSPKKDNLPKPEPTADKALTALETREPSILKRSSPRITTPSFKAGTGWEMKMKCVQCGREKNLSMARTDRFCTRRCVIQWLDEHPDKTPKDAVGDSNTPLFSLPTPTPTTNTPNPSKAKDSTKSSKSVPRALKNLEIDMAAPGTRLHFSEDSDEEVNKNITTPTNDEIPAKSSDLSKRSHFSQPASSAAKRSVVTPQPPAIKKAKNIDKVRTVSPNHNSKSVKFDLDSNSVSTVVTTPPPISFTQSSGLPGSISIVPLDRLTEFVKEQQKKLEGNIAPVKTDVKLPKAGLTRHVQNWSVADVCAYFKATRDCAEFGAIFKEQEVDGFALLKLSDQTMCRCLGLPLGKVIKVMAHVDELKKLAID